MSNPTTPFSWQMPTATDLVTDLPADFEVFGQAVATSMADLLGGTTGQVLSKTTNADMDFTWVTTDDANAIQNSIVDAKGDLISATANDTPARLAVGSNGNSLIADSTTATGLAYAPSGLTQPIINGAFDIAQRGTTTGTMSTTYLLDRWAASTSSGVGTQAQVTGLTVGTEVFRYAWKFTALGAYTFVQMGTQIEFANCYQLQNQQVTISFYAQANNANAASTSLIVRTRTSASVDASVLFTGTVASTNQTITTSGVRYSVTRTLPSTFGALSLEFASGTTGTTGDGFTITGVQIDKGSVALPFRRAGGTISGELAACQRYFAKSYLQGDAPATATSTNSVVFICPTASTGSMHQNVRYPVTMRTTPTLTLYDQLGASGKVYKGANGKTSDVFYTGDAGFAGGTTDATSTTLMVFQYIASAEL